MPARRRSMAEFLEQQRAADTPLETAEAARRPATGATVSPGSLPEPYTTTADGELSEREHAELATCEAALDNLRVAFWAAGKALQVIRDARLYRGTHATFEEYVEQQWDISRPQAYRLIDAWPLAERLSPMGDKLNERQIRELLPLADRHGQDAAVTVYGTVAEANGVQVTAALLRQVIGILPAGHFDPATAAGQIRAYLAGEDTAAGTPRPAADPVEAFTHEASKLLRVLHRVTDHGTLQAALDADPEAVRKVIADMRAMLDAIEHDVSAQPAGRRQLIGLPGSDRDCRAQAPPFRAG